LCQLNKCFFAIIILFFRFIWRKYNSRQRNGKDKKKYGSKREKIKKMSVTTEANKKIKKVNKNTESGKETFIKLAQPLVRIDFFKTQTWSNKIEFIKDDKQQNY